MRGFNLLIAAFALLQCIRYARGALLFLAPRIELRPEPGASPASPARLRAAAELEGLGFEPLGILHESGPLGALRRERDVLGDGARGVFADIVEERAGGAVTLELVTAFEEGALVVTSTGRRRGIDSPRLQVGVLPGASASGLLGAHEVAIARFTAAHGRAVPADALDRRAALARWWYGSEGRRELRRAHAVAFAVVVVSVALFASSAHILLRTPAAR